MGISAHVPLSQGGNIKVQSSRTRLSVQVGRAPSPVVLRLTAPYISGPSINAPPNHSGISSHMILRRLATGMMVHFCCNPNSTAEIDYMTE